MRCGPCAAGVLAPSIILVLTLALSLTGCAGLEVYRCAACLSALATALIAFTLNSGCALR